MKIRRITTYVLRVPLGKQRFYSSQCAFPERNSLLVRIEDDAGRIGWGEGGQYGPAEPLASCINDVFRSRLIGRDVLDVESIWDDLYTFSRDFGQKGTYVEAISAIDVALHDLRGQLLGQPIYRLLGGARRTKLATYATGCYYRGEDHLDHRGSLRTLADEAKSYVDAGFRAIKIKVGLLSVDADAERVRAIRESIGPSTALLVDANHAYNAFTAVRMGRVLEEARALWFEEPVVPEDHDGYRRVREQLDVPIAGGESEWTRFGFRDFLSRGCVDIAQPDVCVCGGISEFQKILAIASAHNTAVIPHVWGSGIAMAAAIHCIAAMPPMPHTANPVALQNEPVFEFDRNHNPLRDDLLVGRPVRLVDGLVPILEEPGLGVGVDIDVLKRYCTHRGGDEV